MTLDNGWLWYRGLRQHLGLWRKKQWIKGQKRWHALHPEPENGYICALCGWYCRPTKYRKDWQPIKDYDFTLDHKIPVAVILENLDRYDIDLLWHPSNLQAAHSHCNGHKGSSMADNIVYAPPLHVKSPEEVANLQSLVAKKAHMV